MAEAGWEAGIAVSSLAAPIITCHVSLLVGGSPKGQPCHEGVVAVHVLVLSRSINTALYDLPCVYVLEEDADDATST